MSPEAGRGEGSQKVAVMGILDHLNLPTLGEMQRQRTAKPKGAEPSRLQRKVAEARDERKDEDAWRKAIWTRDKGACRWCKRAVVRSLELRPDRGECHHVVPRENRVTRWDPRAALLACAACHERLTGKVGGERFVVVASRVFAVDGVEYPDCRHSVQFKRIDKAKKP